MSLREALSGGPLSAMAEYPRFIVYHLVWDEGRNKWDKVPCDFNGRASDAHTIQHAWQNALAAAERLGDQFGVGYVFNVADGFFFLDIDNCLVNEKWSDVAIRLLGMLPGAAVEVSVSGKGLHIFGRGSIPLHGCKNTVLGLELYHEGRFVALTGNGAVGSASTDCSAGLAKIVAEYFPPPASVEFTWTDLNVPVVQDAFLLAKMLKTNSAAGMFGGKATFSDLWNANVTVLGKSYPAEGRTFDASSADMALCQHLAFWTKKDCARMWRLAWNSALVRDKWRDRPEYVRDTILAACARQTEVYKGDEATQAPVPVLDASLSLAPATPENGNGAYRQLKPDDFVFYAPGNEYIMLSTNDAWRREALLKELDKTSVEMIDMQRRVHCRAWDPLEPQFIFDRVMSIGTAGWQYKENSTTMNTYQPSSAKLGDPAQAGPWLDQCSRLYPDHWKHMVAYFAFLRQHPGVKINHGIVMGGYMGIGKDSILKGVEYAIGSQNLKEVSPAGIFGDFSPWTKCVMLRVNEVHDLGDGGHGSINRTAFYERMKIVLAAPPDTLTFNDKHVKSYPVRNCCGVVLTTNHPAGAMHIPDDDRRLFVIWSDVKKDEYTEAQWTAYWDWFNGENSCQGQQPGREHVAALLQVWDIRDFKPKATPPRTAAWDAMVAASRSEGDNELADVLDGMGRPPAVTLNMMRTYVELMKCEGVKEDLEDRKMGPRWAGRMAAAGYTPCRNTLAKDGCWKLWGKRETVYCVRDISERERQAAAEKLTTLPEIPKPPSSEGTA